MKSVGHKQSRKVSGGSGLSDYSEEMLLFSVLHLLYDSTTAQHFRALVPRVCVHLGWDGDDEIVCNIILWMHERRHCRYNWRRSDATQIVQKLLSHLKQPVQRYLFLTLIVCACNHRRCYFRWFQIAHALPLRPRSEFRMEEIIYEVEDVLFSESWLAMPREYPVSSATAYRVGLSNLPPDKADRHATLIRRVTLRVLQIFMDIWDALPDLSRSDDWKRQMSTLQISMFCRYAQIPCEERWTRYSKKYVPKGYTPSSLGTYFLDRICFGNSYPLAELLQWSVGVEESQHIYGPDHMEHMACEFRKCKDGSCLRRGSDTEDAKRTATTKECVDCCAMSADTVHLDLTGVSLHHHDVEQPMSPITITDSQTQWEDSVASGHTDTIASSSELIRIVSTHSNFSSCVGKCWFHWIKFSDKRSNPRRYRICPVFAIGSISEGGDQFALWECFASPGDLCRSSLVNFVSFSTQRHRFSVWYKACQNRLQRQRLLAWSKRERMHAGASTDQDVIYDNF